jgi:hypothetical protein
MHALFLGKPGRKFWWIPAVIWMPFRRGDLVRVRGFLDWWLSFGLQY